jgi:hypothetical protein
VECSIEPSTDGRLLAAANEAAHVAVTTSLAAIRAILVANHNTRMHRETLVALPARLKTSY